MKTWKLLGLIPVYLLLLELAACLEPHEPPEPPEPPEPLTPCVLNDLQCDCDGVLGQDVEPFEACTPGVCLFDVASWDCYCAGEIVDPGHCAPPQPCAWSGAEDCECAGYPAPETYCQ